jgi:hypothetical protein
MVAAIAVLLSLGVTPRTGDRVSERVLRDYGAEDYLYPTEDVLLNWRNNSEPIEGYGASYLLAAEPIRFILVANNPDTDLNASCVPLTPLQRGEASSDARTRNMRRRPALEAHGASTGVSSRVCADCHSLQPAA